MGAVTARHAQCYSSHPPSPHTMTSCINDIKSGSTVTKTPDTDNKGTETSHSFRFQAIHPGGRGMEAGQCRGRQERVAAAGSSAHGRPGCKEKGRLAISSFSLLFKCLCEWVFCLHACLCTMCMPGGHRGDRIMWGWSYRWVVVSVCAGARNPTQVLWKSSRCSGPSLLAPPVLFLSVLPVHHGS